MVTALLDMLDEGAPHCVQNFASSLIVQPHLVQFTLISSREAPWATRRMPTPPLLRRPTTRTNPTVQVESAQSRQE